MPAKHLWSVKGPHAIQLLKLIATNKVYPGDNSFKEFVKSNKEVSDHIEINNNNYTTKSFQNLNLNFKRLHKKFIKTTTKTFILKTLSKKCQQQKFQAV